MKILPSFQLAGIAAALAAVLGAGGAWRTTSWYYQAQERKEAGADLRAERARHTEQIHDLYRQLTIAREASNGFQKELQTLRDTAPRPQPVRLCPKLPAATGAVAADPAEPRFDDSTAPFRVVPGGVPQGHREGPDIGPDLERIIERCEIEVAKLRGHQARVLGSALP